jgi:hypothetical protein
VVKVYGLVDIDALGVAAGVDIRRAFGALKDLYQQVDTRNARNTVGLNLPCYRGCSACCYESVFLTPLEFLYVWDYVQTTFTVSEINDVVQKALALYTTHQATIETFLQPVPSNETDHFKTASQLRFECPLLGSDGTCRVYPVRELYARMFGCSLNDDFGVYGCDLVSAYLKEKTVSLSFVRKEAQSLNLLPLTGMRQVYPYYVALLYGIR